MAQNSNAVGKFLDLVHLVGDYDYRLARIAHTAQNGKELIGLLRGEHRRRLVKNENVRAAVEHLDNLHRLLLRNAHLVNVPVGIDVKAVGVADLADLLRRRLEVELALALEAENDILRRGEHVNELKMLMDHADAEIERVLGGADDDGLVVDEYLALVGEIYAGKHIHKGRFARAVFTQKRQNLASVYVEPYLVVSFDRAEGF